MYVNFRSLLQVYTPYLIANWNGRLRQRYTHISNFFKERGQALTQLKILSSVEGICNFVTNFGMLFKDRVLKAMIVPFLNLQTFLDITFSD